MAAARSQFSPATKAVLLQIIRLDIRANPQPSTQHPKPIAKKPKELGATQNATGSRFVEAILSVDETCRQQEGVVAFLAASIPTHRKGRKLRHESSSRQPRRGR